MVPCIRKSQPLNGISIGLSVFAELTRVPNTRTRTQTTLRATSVAINRIYAVRAMQPNSNNNNGTDRLAERRTSTDGQTDESQGCLMLTTFMAGANVTATQN